MRRARAAGGRAERGTIPVEAALVMPVLLVFVLLAVAAGRISTARGVVDAATREAARAASLERTSGTARVAALRAARGTLGQQGVHCAALAVHVDTSGVAAGGARDDAGRVRTVAVSVHCSVRLGDVAVPGLPGSVAADGRFTSVVDRFRSTGGGAG